MRSGCSGYRPAGRHCFSTASASDFGSPAFAFGSAGGDSEVCAFDLPPPHNEQQSV